MINIQQAEYRFGGL